MFLERHESRKKGLFGMNSGTASSARTQDDLIKAAGGILWRGGPQGDELAVIYRGRHKDWTLPKGKLDPGESWEEAALREIREETGCNAELIHFADALFYMVKDRPKVVLYWHMRLIGEPAFQPSEEVEKLAWMRLPEALEILSYSAEKEMLETCGHFRGKPRPQSG
jgi:8-oxo-(d)GTP phosphatase